MPPADLMSEEDKQVGVVLISDHFPGNPDLFALDGGPVTDAQFNELGSQFLLQSGPMKSILTTKESSHGTIEGIKRKETSDSADSIDSGYQSGPQGRSVHKSIPNMIPRSIPDGPSSEVVGRVLVNTSHRHRFKRPCNHPSSPDRHKHTVHQLIRKISHGEHWKCLIPACPKAGRNWSRRNNISSHVSRIHGLYVPPWCTEQSEKLWTGQVSPLTDVDQKEKAVPLNSSQFMEHCTNIRKSTKNLKNPHRYNAANNVDNLQEQLEPLNVGSSEDDNVHFQDTTIPYQSDVSTDQADDSHADTDSYTSGDHSVTNSIMDIGLSTHVLAICEEIGVATANHAGLIFSNNPNMLRKCGTSETTNTATSSHSDIGRKASTNTTSSRGSRRRRKGDDDIEDRGNNGHSANRPTVQPSSKIPRKTFACPYNKADPRLYSKDNPDEDNSKYYRHCPVVLLKGISAVKQHCKRTHRWPKFCCYRCYEAFKTKPELQAHCGREEACRRKPPKYNDRMTTEQEEEMYAITGANQEDVYLRIFRILLPGYPEPESIYQSSGSEELIRFGLSLFRTISPLEALRIINQRVQSRQDIPISEGRSLEVIEEIFQVFFENFYPQLPLALEGRLQTESWPSETQATSNSNGDPFDTRSIPLQFSQESVPRLGESAAPNAFAPNIYGHLNQSTGHEHPTFHQNESRTWDTLSGNFNEQSVRMNYPEPHILQFWERTMMDLADYGTLDDSGEDYHV